MLLREALTLLRSARYSDAHKLCLLCSFEPLHFKSYLQAFLVERFPDAAPQLTSWGYDQLEVGLQESSHALRVHPALLFLSWGDLHPHLSWRTRGPLEMPSPGDIQGRADALRERLVEWLTARGGADSYVVVPPLAWLPLSDHVAPGALGVGSMYAWAAMGAVVAELAQRGCRVLDLPVAALNMRDWLGAGCPLTVEDSERAARRAVELIYPPRERKKALVVDLDGTLWHGVIGEDGPERIMHGPEGLGFPFHVFQKFLLKLKGEGVLLAFCTKNNPADVLPVFDKLEMPLSIADFAAYRCNWEPKPENLRAIAAELNIGLDSVVCVDDSPAELALMANVLPEVRALPTPRTGQDWLRLFEELQGSFATWRVGEEDRARTASSAQARSRAAAGSAAEVEPGSLRHLRGFDLELTVRHDAFGDPRSLELVNKTNQFNLTGERWSASDWLLKQQAPGAFCLSARLRDRFGDFGTIVVLVGITRPDGCAELQQIVMSCRAFGRGVEAVALGWLCRWADVGCVSGRFVDTGKNAPTAKFLRDLKCEWTGDGNWRLTRPVIEAWAKGVLDDTGMRVRSSHG
jgi:FkbH-like protein